MKTNDLAIISSVAMATAALTVAFFLPNSLNAGNDTAPAQIVQPKLVSNGVEFTLTAAENQTFNAGDKAAFELKAVNTTAENAEAAVQVSMTSMSPPSARSRMVAIDQPLWQETSPVTLKPNETKVIALDSKTRLPQDKTVRVILRTLAPEKAATPEPQQRQLHSGPPTAPSAVVALTYSTVKPAQAVKPAVN